MPDYKTKFNDSWLEQVDSNGHVLRMWCKKGSMYTGHCIICNRTFACDSSGLPQLLSHAKSEKHKDLMKSHFSSTQRRLTTTKTVRDDEAEGASTSLVTLREVPKWTHADRVTKAEILWTIKVANATFSYDSTEGIGELFRQMFNDNQSNSVVGDFKLSASKVSYTISHGLGPYFREDVVSTLKNSGLPYTLHLDETTTVQVSKQLDLLVRYWSAGRVVVRYLTSVFLGHATADIMLGEIVSTLNRDEIPLRNLVHVSTDGPNVNKSLLEKLEVACKNAGSPGLVNIGPCNIHVVHNSFAAGLKVIEHWGIEEFLLDIHQWFKYSAPRREDYSKVQELLDIDEHAFMRYVSSRWLSMVPVIQRVLEQYEGLREYFLKFLPQHEARTCKNNQRYKQIENHLKDKMTLTKLHFVKSVGLNVTDFLTKFQKEGPLIHLLHAELCDMLLRLLQKFMTNDALADHQDRTLLIVNVKDTSKCLSLDQINIGHEARTSLNRVKSGLPSGVLQTFYLDARSFYQSVTAYMQGHLPLNNSLVKNLQCLHPPTSRDCDDQVIKDVARALKHTGISGDILDRLGEEWMAYKSDPEITESMYVQSKSENDGVLNVVYKGIDEYWTCVSQLTRPDGEPKFPLLVKVARVGLLLSHGNSDVERGFSRNNLLVTKQRANLANESICGLRLVQDAVRVNGGILGIPITRQMILTVRGAHAKYKEDCDRRRSADEAKQKEKIEAEAERKRKRELDGTLQQALQKHQKEIDSAHALVAEASNRLGAAVKANDSVGIKAAHALLDSGNKSLAEHLPKVSEICNKIAAGDKRIKKCVK